MIHQNAFSQDESTAILELFRMTERGEKTNKIHLAKIIWICFSSVKQNEPSFCQSILQCAFPAVKLAFTAAGQTIKKGTELVSSHLIYTSFGCSNNNSVIMILQHNSCQVSCTRPTAKPLTDTSFHFYFSFLLQHSIMILGQSLGFNHETCVEQSSSCS